MQWPTAFKNLILCLCPGTSWTVFPGSALWHASAFFEGAVLLHSQVNQLFNQYLIKEFGSKELSSYSIYKILWLSIPNGKRISFWYKTAPAADANYLRIRKQSKNSAYSHITYHGADWTAVWNDLKSCRNSQYT